MIRQTILALSLLGFSGVALAAPAPVTTTVSSPSVTPAVKAHVNHGRKPELAHLQVAKAGEPVPAATPAPTPTAAPAGEAKGKDEPVAKGATDPAAGKKGHKGGHKAKTETKPTEPAPAAAPAK